MDANQNKDNFTSTEKFPLYSIIYTRVLAMVGWGTLSFLSFCFLEASVLRTCISIYIVCETHYFNLF